MKRNFLLLKLCILAFFMQGLSFANAQFKTEAETNFTVINEATVRQEWAGPIGSGNYAGTTCSGGAYLSIAVATDEVRIPLTVSSAGEYNVLVRVRSGWTGESTVLANQYEIKINDVLTTTSLLAGSVTDVIDVDSYYGTLKSATVNLTSGVNYVKIKALGTWQKVDYIDAETVTPTAPRPTLAVYQLTSEPTIDGDADAIWANIPWQEINQRDLTDNGGTARTPDSDFDAKLKVAWRNNKLFLFYDVTDNTLFYNQTLARYNQDNIAVKFNFAATHLTDISYTGLSKWNYQAAINQSSNSTNGFVGGRSALSTAENGWGWPSTQSQFPASQIITKAKTSGNGYTVEIAFDLSDANWGLPSALANGITFGFDAGVDDVDVEGGARKQLYWSNLGKGNNSWDDLSGLGIATIKSSNGYTHFRSKASGNWSDATKWECSEDGTTWIDAFSVPNQVANEITVATDKLMNIDANAVINQLTLAPGAKLSLNTGNTLSVTTLTLNSDATGTATFVDTNNNSPQAITATVQQYISAGRNWYTSSPIINATAAILNRGTSVQTYTESTKAWSVLNTSDVLTPGKGYISAATATSPGTSGNVSFTGTLNTGAVTVPLTRTESGSSRGFNLVANPYPSYLDWSEVIADSENNSILTTMWFRTKNTDGTYTFSTHNGTSGLTVSGIANTSISKLIPPMQSFWVRVKQNASSTTYNTNIIFKNSMRSHRDVSANTIKAPRLEERKLLRIAVSNAEVTDEALLYFDLNAQNEFDDYDSPKMFAGSKADLPEIFTFSGPEKVVINGMNNIPFNTEIPLGFITSKANSFSLKMKEMLNFEQGTNLFLKDSKLNNEFDLTTGLAYNFSSDSIAVSGNRFSLIFRNKDLTTANPYQKNTIVQVLLNNQNQISVLTDENFSYIIYNALGQKLYSGFGLAKQTLVSPSMSSGLYVVKLQIAERELNTKLIIK